MSLEQDAVRWRAITGIVPYWLWVRLSAESRGRMESMSQTAARRQLVHEGRVFTSAEDAAFTDLAGEIR